MREILQNFNKLVKDLQSQESPEAMAYLRIMGAELGFIKGSDLKSVAEMYANIFQKITPSKVLFCGHNAWKCCKTDVLFRKVL